MGKIEAIFRISQEYPTIIRKSANKLNISRNTFRKYMADIKDFRNLYPVEASNFKAYTTSLHPLVPWIGNDSNLIDRFSEIFHAISNNGSNRKIEWQAYKKETPKGYGYSQFATLFSRWCSANKLSIASRHWATNVISETDRKIFMQWRRSNDKSKWAKAVIILESSSGISKEKLIQKVERSRRQVKKWIEAYEQFGIQGLTKRSRKVSEQISANIRLKKDNLIKLIHETPKLHGINRATWGIKSLSNAYFKTYGVEVSKSTISEYIKSEGYAFKYAKKVLTSPDPLYREKLGKITSILSNLKSNEKFFSVDEFGPFAIKLIGGRSLVRRDEIKSYPQWQKSKGCLICTAALELSENQTTHFFSGKKNTKEMIKLVEILIEKYRGQSRIFFSWDAASWHASKKLHTRISEINCKEYRKSHGTPTVELAPLPASAQFLNVIESIFSGMAKAIIHNSNYQSVDECKMAIDLYFKERNEYFIVNPKRAGNKIWGKEQVLPVFNEATIYKNSRWR